MKASNKIVSLLLTLCLMVGILPAAASAADDTLTHLALGDSISTGYGLESIETERFTSQVAAHYGLTEVNKAVNGATATDLSALLSSGELDEDLASASLITLTCGGNEMVAILCDEIANNYNAKNNTNITGDDVVVMLQNGKLMSMLSAITGAIKGFSESAEFKKGLEAYSKDLTAVLTYIREKNSHAQVVVCTQFNPYKKFQSNRLLGFAYAEVDKAVVALNQVILNNAATLNYTVADAYTPFRDSKDSLFPGGNNVMEASFVDFHPNAAGHALIAKTINDLNLTITPPPSSEPVEPGEPGISYTEADVSLADGTVKVALSGMDGVMSVTAAFYNENGKMIGIDYEVPAANTSEITLSAELRGNAVSVRVFLMNSVYAPVVPAV